MATFPVRLPKPNSIANMASSYNRNRLSQNSVTPEEHNPTKNHYPQEEEHYHQVQPEKQTPTESTHERFICPKSFRHSNMTCSSVREAIGSAFNLKPKPSRGSRDPQSLFFKNKCTISNSNNRHLSSSRNENNIRNDTKTLERSRGSMDRQDLQDRQERIWKTAIDHKSGRTYYYDVVTRATQWRKPMELTTADERELISQKEQKQREFFQAMESNILKCLAQGSVPGIQDTTKMEDTLAPGSDIAYFQSRQGQSCLLSRPSSISVRTISTMNDTVLQELVGVGANVNKDRKRDGSSPCNVMDTPYGLSSQISSRKSRDSSLAPRATMMNRGNLGCNWHQEEGHDAIQAWLGKGLSISLLDEDLYDDDYNETYREEALAQVKRVADAMTRESDIPSIATSKVQDQTQDETTRATLQRPVLGKRRNTCGTLYVRATMSAPDKEATIKCICAVYRAHIIQSIKEKANRPKAAYFEEYEIFNDFKIIQRPDISANTSTNTVKIVTRNDSFETYMPNDNEISQSEIENIPSLEEISLFYRNIFLTSQMESECIIMSLIYVEKIMRATNNGVRPNLDNWRSLLFSSMIMASKVWDDLSMWNVDFTQTCPKGVTFSLQRINELEMAMLNCLDYEVKVLASEYAKYYFLLRSMLIQSGLGGKDFLDSIPLDLKGAKQLEQNSAHFQLKKSSFQMNRRVKSVGDSSDQDQSLFSREVVYDVKIPSSKAVLENMVLM